MSVTERAGPLVPLLFGEVRWRTRRALLLTTGLAVAAAVFRTTLIGSVHAPLHDCCHHIALAALSGFTDFTASGYFNGVFGHGVVGLALLGAGGLAALHAYLNQGYVLSILLAAAPGYGFYVFNGPGAAPVWAAGVVFPGALLYGTVGFLLGMGVRQLRSNKTTPALT